jgi:ABC-2 type transport system permease protein
MIGYAFGHAVRKPMITQLVTILVSFVILGFAPINYPPENLPAWLADLNQFLPFTHMAAIIRGGLTEGLVDDTPLSYVVLGLYMIVSVIVAAWVVGRRD